LALLAAGWFAEKLVPYVPGVANDVFISYAHPDNEASSDRDRWVSRFVAHLSRELKRRIGLASDEELKIFFDEHSLRTNDNLAVFKENARRSAAFVAIVSPSYLARDWPQAELEAFTAVPSSPGRLFAIESLPPERSYPPSVASLKRAQFWTQAENSETKQRLSPDEKQWDSKVQDVAEHIKALLRQLHDAGGLDEAISRQASFVEGPAPALRTVLLAQVTDDLSEDRDQVRRFLEQYGIAALPVGTYPQGGQDFTRAIEADLGRANFFVQLLGPTAARCPPDLPKGYARHQYEAAKRVAANRPQFSMLLWRRTDLDPGAVVNDDRILLTAPEAMAMTLESFKAEIVRRVEQANAPKRPVLPRSPQSDIHVFINAVEEDQQIADSVQKDFTRNGCTALLPIYGCDAGELRTDLEEKIVWCDAMALVYGEAHPRWISSQAMAYSKLKRKRTEPARIFLICRAPPQPKMGHGVAMPELREIDYVAGGPDDSIKQVVAELRT
jgi:hypothetical protein